MICYFFQISHFFHIYIDGVGKSTLVTSLIREAFVENVPEIVPEVTIPPDVTMEKVMTHIVDSSSKIQYRELLEDEMRRAHVICVVYDVTREETFDRIKEFWIPYIRRLGVNVR
jgi:mitochondrial Rho GTPase 1